MKDNIQTWVDQHGGEDVPAMLSGANASLPGVEQAYRYYDGQTVSAADAQLLAVVARPDVKHETVQYDLLLRDEDHLFSVRTGYSEAGDKKFLQKEAMTHLAPLGVQYPPAIFVPVIALVIASHLLPPFVWVPLGGILGAGLLAPTESTLGHVPKLPDNSAPLPEYDRDQLDDSPTIETVYERDRTGLFTGDLSGVFGDIDLKDEYEKHHATQPGTRLRPADEEGVYVAFTKHADEQYRRIFESESETNHALSDGSDQPAKDGGQNGPVKGGTLRQRIERFEQAADKVDVTDYAMGVLKELYPPADPSRQESVSTTVAETLMAILGDGPGIASDVVQELCSSREFEQIRNELLALPARDKVKMSPYNLLQKARAAADERGYDYVDSTCLLLACLQTDTKAANILHDHDITPRAVVDLLNNLLD